MSVGEMIGLGVLWLLVMLPLIDLLLWAIRWRG
jgi:hypothetical protein